MANNYIEIMKLVNAGNKMGLSNTITRDNGMPLDLSSVQETYEAAVIYAATKAIAYVGQPISVGDKLYIISDTAATAKFVAADGTEYDNFLKEVGTIPTGDNASITVTADGLVSLFGFAGAENGMLPVREDGKLTWKTLEAIGAGDGNDNTTYEFALNDSETGIIVTPIFNGQPIMEGEEGAQTQKKFELVLNVYTKSEADEKFLAKADYTPYDDTDLVDRVATIEGDYLKAADKYDDTEVKERLDAIEADYLKAEDKYNDAELASRITTVEGKVDAFLTGTGATEALDSLQELIAYIDEHDGADLTEMFATIEGIESKLAGVDTTVTAYVTAAIEALKIGDYAKAADLTALASRVEALEKKPFDTYATKQELADHASDMEDTLESTLAPYAKTADVNTELAKKVDSATIAHTTEEKAEGVTVDGTQLNIVVDAFTKAETRKYVEDTIGQMTGGESAADVLLALNNYKSDNDERVGAIETKNTEQDAAIAEAKAQADKGVADAATAQAKADEAATQANTNKGDIETVKSRLTTLETAKGDHETRIATAEGKITALETTTSNNSKAIGELQGADKAHTAEDERLAGLITGLQSDKADKSDTYTKKEVDDAVAAAITGANLSDFAKVTDVEAIYKAGEGETPASGVLAVEIERAKAAEKANANAIAALVGEDTDKTIREIAATETAKIVAGADEKYDTLKEIADFITSDTTGAAKMATDIVALQTTVGNAESGLVKAVADNAAAIAAIVQPKASTEISVAANGELGIIGVSTDKLVQGSDTLVLNGGDASIKVTE